MFIELNAEQVEQATQRIARIQGRFARFGPGVADRVEALIHNAMRQQYATRGRWGGARWANLKPATVVRKRLAGTYHKGVLRDSDRMFDALVHGVRPDFDMDVTNEGATAVVNVPHAVRHQTGTKHMVARPPIPEPMPDSFLTDLKNIVSGYLIAVELAED
jgi:hypothetical protein